MSFLMKPAWDPNHLDINPICITEPPAAPQASLCSALLKTQTQKESMTRSVADFLVLKVGDDDEFLHHYVFKREACLILGN